MSTRTTRYAEIPRIAADAAGLPGVPPVQDGLGAAEPPGADGAGGPAVNIESRIPGLLAPHSAVTVRPRYVRDGYAPLGPWRVCIGEKVVARCPTREDAMEVLYGLNRVFRRLLP